MVQSIIKELILRSDDCEEIIETIYFGGGTPSIMSVDEIDQILTKITENYTVSDHVEITLETNPDDITNNKLIKTHNKHILPNVLYLEIMCFSCLSVV